MKRRDIIIFVLLAVALFLLWQRTMCTSYFSNEDVNKARDMLSKGFKDLDIAAELARKGVDPNDVLKVIEQAKGAPVNLGPPAK